MSQTIQQYLQKDTRVQLFLSYSLICLKVTAKHLQLNKNHLSVGACGENSFFLYFVLGLKIVLHDLSIFIKCRSSCFLVGHEYLTVSESLLRKCNYNKVFDLLNIKSRILCNFGLIFKQECFYLWNTGLVFLTPKTWDNSPNNIEIRPTQTFSVPRGLVTGLVTGLTALKAPLVF